MALRDKTGIIATKGGGTQEDIKAESVIFTPTEDITSTDVQSAIEEVNTNVSKDISDLADTVDDLSDDLTSHTDTTIDSETGVHGLRYFDGKLQAFIGDAWIDVGGGGKSPFGASIKLILPKDKSDLIGKTFNLIKNDEIVASEIMPDDKSVTFTDLMTSGSYTISCEDEKHTYSISAENVLSKDILEVWFVEPCILTLGNIYNIAGANYMCCEELDGGYVMFTTSIMHSFKTYSPIYLIFGSSTVTDVSGRNLMVNDNAKRGYINSRYPNTSHFIETTELQDAPFGSGLYLPSFEKAQGPYYLSAMKTLIGGSDNRIITGTPASRGGGYYKAYQWTTGSTTYDFVDVNFGSSSYYDVTGAFNLDSNKVYLDGNEIKIKE